MKTVLNKILVTIIALLLLITAEAQTAIDSAKTIALGFFKTYDSIPYITFDVKYTYYSDTLYSDFSYETIKGSYTMSGKKAKYSMGDVDYLQNDSFLIAVYHKDETMVLSSPAQEAGSYLPMRSLLDSLLDAYSADYDISVKTKPDTTIGGGDTTVNAAGYILLTKKPSATNAQLNRYIIEYDIIYNTITKVEYEFTEPGQTLTSTEEPDAGQRKLKNSARKRVLRIDFTNYRFDNLDDNVYSENTLVWEEDGQYKPVEKYKYYKVINTKD